MSYILQKYAILSLAVAVMVSADASDKPQVEILTEKNVVSGTGYDFEWVFWRSVLSPKYVYKNRNTVVVQIIYVYQALEIEKNYSAIR